MKGADLKIPSVAQMSEGKRRGKKKGVNIGSQTHCSDGPQMPAEIISLLRVSINLLCSGIIRNT